MSSLLDRVRQRQKVETEKEAEQGSDRRQTDADDDLLQDAAAKKRASKAGKAEEEPDPTS